MLRLSAVVFGLSTSAALATGFSLPVKSLNDGVLEAPGDDRTGRVATDDPAAISAQEQQSPVEEDLPIDGDVVGLVNAQSQEAARFAMQMTDHVRQRLEGLRDANCHAIDLGLRLNVTDVTDGGSQNPLIIDNRRDQSFELGSGSLARQASVACGDDPVAAWTGGFLSVGSFETTGADILDFTTVGLASGLDLRVSPTFLVGMALGYASDDSTVGTDGSGSRGVAGSVSAYASYSPSEDAFIDATLSFDRLDFSQRRARPGGSLRELGPEHATGRRAGHQLTAAVTAGLTARWGKTTLTPFSSISATGTRLDPFEERSEGTEAAPALSFGRQASTRLASSVGLRATRQATIGKAKLTFSQTMEWSRDFGSGSSTSFDRKHRLGPRRYWVATDRRDVSLYPVTSGVKMSVGKATSLSLDHRTTMGGALKAKDHSLRLSFTERF
ncbi:hypothetical protein ASG43_17780 [Aureimonas sp. Leaf454]|nr:hypothetical protein ASG43_17780 [Aureimonas sp. Leaf454]